MSAMNNEQSPRLPPAHSAHSAQSAYYQYKTTQAAMSSSHQHTPQKSQLSEPLYMIHPHSISPQPSLYTLRPSASPELVLNSSSSASPANSSLYTKYLGENRDRFSVNSLSPSSASSGGGGHDSVSTSHQRSYQRSPSPHNAHFLTPQRADALSAACQIGVLSPSTPPISRQRRHSKLNLRIAGGMSVDHGDGPPLYQPATTSSLNVSSTSGNSGSGQSANKPKDRYRIVIMGSSAVGKTAIVEQFLYGSFPETHCATVEELHKGEYEISGGSAIPLEILDTSGSFEFPAMRRLAISTGDAFALIYSIDSQTSFEEVKSMREMIMDVKGSDPAPPIVVVGNKCDLEQRRTVKIEQAECECMDWDVGFVECSAKNNRNIVNIFSCMLIQARLKGTLNVVKLTSPPNAQGRHIGYRDPTEIARSRRRSSLPISELFSRFPRGNHDSRASSAASSQSSSTFRKRNSCTPS